LTERRSKFGDHHATTPIGAQCGSWGADQWRTYPVFPQSYSANFIVTVDSTPFLFLMSSQTPNAIAALWNIA